MKIAMIGQKGMPAYYGGVERHVEELSTRLVQSGHEVTVYSRKWFTKKADGEINGVKIKNLPSLRTKHLDTITHVFLATLDAIKNKYEVIHYHGIGPSLLSWIPRIFAPRTLVIATFHSIDRKHQKWGLLARLVLRFSEWATCHFPHLTIAVSQTIRQYCRDVYDKEVIFIPNGVPTLTPKNATNHLTDWNLQPKKYVVMVSRLIPHKGAHYLVHAWQKLQRESAIQDFKLVIVGDGYYTETYVKALKKLAGDNPNIIFTGFQSGEALAQLLSHAYLFVHPSDNEGTPINVLEAMSYGLPVLLSDIPEHQELIKNKDFLFTHANSQELAEKIKNLLQADPQKLTLEGKKNTAIVTADYNWKNITEHISELYQNPPLMPMISSLPS